jgi:hypothetical protein
MTPFEWTRRARRFSSHHRSTAPLLESATAFQFWVRRLALTLLQQQAGDVGTGRGSIQEEVV